MDFTEQVKLEVKEKAAFKCCRCQSIGIEIHHIIPQETGGTSDIDNAAPLCPSCHSYYGGNPDKRKEIRQMRDWWYERVKNQFPNNDEHTLLVDMSNKLDYLQLNMLSIEDFRRELTGLALRAIDNMTLGTASTTASGIISSLFPPSPSPSPSPSVPEEEE